MIPKHQHGKVYNDIHLEKFIEMDHLEDRCILTYKNSQIVEIMQYLVQRNKKFNYDFSLFKNIDFSSRLSKKVNLMESCFDIDS